MVVYELRVNAVGLVRLHINLSNTIEFSHGSAYPRLIWLGQLKHRDKTVPLRFCWQIVLMLNEKICGK